MLGRRGQFRPPLRDGLAGPCLWSGDPQADQMVRRLQRRTTRIRLAASIRAAGLARDALYLLRPDTYVALADPSGAPEAVDRYCAKRRLPIAVGRSTGRSALRGLD